MNVKKVKEMAAELEGDFSRLFYDVETIRTDLIEKELLEIVVRFGRLVEEVQRGEL